jgi:mycothiol synthase
VWVERSTRPQLELSLAPSVPDVSVPPAPDGYRVRVLTPQDEGALVRLLQRAGFDFDARALENALSVCVPRGCFVVEHIPTGALSATMMARHVASRAHPFGGRIDWLATDPDHRNRGLGGICARSATRRLLEAGYADIWVTTDDHRLGALKTFLGIGFRPVLTPSTESRWRQVLQNLGGARESTGAEC